MASSFRSFFRQIKLHLNAFRLKSKRPHARIGIGLVCLCTIWRKVNYRRRVFLNRNVVRFDYNVEKTLRTKLRRRLHIISALLTFHSSSAVCFGTSSCWCWNRRGLISLSLWIFPFLLVRVSLNFALITTPNPHTHTHRQCLLITSSHAVTVLIISFG